ncbi:hypothetical protein VKT23_013626 [Stygiomarasmius scandens]|uniref:Ribonuclease H1 N-terminal domain-containing protein n=1 Tax=Marasmiellus scandens TaxID=2682957 RepID=A0ABR1J5Q5_9AGAR
MIMLISVPTVRGVLEFFMDLLPELQALHLHFSQAIMAVETSGVQAQVSVIANASSGTRQPASSIHNGTEINDTLPLRTPVFLAYKRCPHPDELQRNWPLDNHNKAYVVFRGSRIGVFPTWEIAQVFILRVSGAHCVRFKRFSEALSEYRRRFFRTALVSEIEVRPGVANPLFDFEDTHFDGDLQILVPPNDRPFAIPVEHELPPDSSHANNDYQLAEGVISASVPGSAHEQCGNGVLSISDDESE